MAIFTSFRRRPTSDSETSDRELPEVVRAALPPGFEAVAEALYVADDAAAACAVVGRAAARDGAGLGEALDGLRTTHRLVVQRDPCFDDVHSLSVAWSEATLEFVHGLACEDPLTGLATVAHLRTRLEEIYRESFQTGVPVQGSHALVLLEMVAPAGNVTHQFTRALNLAQITDLARAVFSGEETIGRVGADRAAVVVRRAPELGASVAMLRDLIGDLDLGATGTRIWIEGLPATAESAARLLDELARS